MNIGGINCVIIGFFKVIDRVFGDFECGIWIIGFMCGFRCCLIKI